MRHLNASSVCMKEKTRTRIRSSANWNWTMRQKEGSLLSILTLSRCVCINVCYGDRMLKLHVIYLVLIVSYLLFFSECRVSGGGQYPVTRYASCPIQHSYSRHPPSRGSASLHTEKGHRLWVGILLFLLNDLHVKVLHIYTAAEIFVPLRSFFSH